jgi:excisionase family DNA binding protein
VPQPQVSITLTGLEAVIERVVEEKLDAALAKREPERWLTADEAAEHLGIARSTLHDLVCDGRLPRHGPKGSRLRFRREDLDAYAQRRD